MKLIGLLSWYDEPCPALAATIIGLHKAGIDHLVAVDGAYLLYPDSHASSPIDQAALIHVTCAELGIATTIHTPQERWIGNEVEKRTRMFALAHSISDPGDWWISMDADMVITQTPDDLKAQLEQTTLDVATAMISETGLYPLRLLYRAQPMYCDTKHCVYRTTDGRYLWAPQEAAQQEPALDLPDLIVEHRTQQRSEQRNEAKAVYYQRRERYGIERNEVAHATH